MSTSKYPVVIDVHSHIRVPEVLDYMKDYPITATGPGTDDWYVDNSRSSASANMVELEKQRKKVSTDPAERIRQLDERRVDIQVISVNFPNTCYWMEPENGLHAARLANKGIAEFCSYAPDRLIPLGVVPMQAPELAAAELERCVKELGFRGAWINSHVRAKDIGEEQFRAFWAKAEELDVPVFVHPLNAVDFDRLRKHFRFNAIGNPLEETLAMASLIYEGILDDFPKLKPGICHGGGYLPYYPGRVDYCYDTNRGGAAEAFRQRPSEYFGRFFYDTNTFDRYALEVLIKRAGVSQVMYGSDWPAIPEDYFHHIEELSFLSDEDRQRIVWKNAAELYKISV
ncbi:MAG: amidohydrolase [Rhodobacteraceae bacterium]|nr:amidohydrolase [Paracoccaceae bacterium]MBR9821035.1 amidohydrolase [Paracoccaceae bacterium]